jgi:Site-specific recombinase XerD
MEVLPIIRRFCIMPSRRGNGEGSIFKRNDGKWCGVVTNGRDKEGRLNRQYVYGKSRQEVADKILKMQHEIKTGTYIEPTKVKVGEWLDLWLQEYMKPSLRPTTFGSYEHIIRTHIKPELGDIILKDLRPEHLQKLYNEKFRKGRVDGTGGLSAKYVRYIHNLVHESLDQAIKNQLIARNVSEATTLPRQEKKEIRVLSVEEQRRFTEVLENDPWGSAIKLDLASGLRLGELLALKWKDIDFEEGVIRVRSSLARVKVFENENNPVPSSNTKRKETTLIFQEPKTKSGKRNIPIPDNILKELKEHLERQENEKNFMGEAYVDYGLVFCTQYGTPIEPRNMMRRFYQLVSDAGLQKANFHALRHTYATRALEAGIHPKVVQEILGHSNISMTLDIYSHVMPELKKEAAGKLNHLFDRKNYDLPDDETIEPATKNKSKVLTKSRGMEIGI